MHRSRFELSSLYTPAEGDAPPRYELRLLNRSGAAISGFRLGVSGPGRIADRARLEGGTIIAQLSNWCEIAAPEGYALLDGEIWSIATDALEFDFRHWTDGATGAMLIQADGQVEPVLVAPCLRAGATEPYPTGVTRLPAPTPSPGGLSIIPWPQHISISGWRNCPAGLSPQGTHPEALAAIQSFSGLVRGLFPGEALVRPEAEGGARVQLFPLRDLPPEAYRLTFGPDAINLEAASATGLLYGLITLGQLLRGARFHPQSFAWPMSGEIEDAPEMAWRGCHLDVARRFYGSGEIAQFLRILAWNKLNRFHWHLSDDEAWRLDLLGFPELTGIAAWRGYGLPIPPLLGSAAEATGGFYTRASVTELIRLAAGLGIDIVPEIDLPGHCYALLQAMPELRDSAETGLYRSIQGFPNNCLNPAVEQVYRVLENVLGEICDLFPSRYLHIGADEVPEDAWSGSPLAQNLLRQLGGGGAPALQAHFLRRLQDFLQARGKVIGAWEEAAQNDGIAPAQSYLVGWHSVEISQQLADRGYDVVSSPGQNYYLDMAQSPDWHEPGAGWAGWSSPEATYAFDPAEGWTPTQRRRLLGVQACIWNEPMSDRAVFDRLVFPRLSAIAETGWTEPSRKDFSRFIAAAGLMPSLYGRQEAAP